MLTIDNDHKIAYLTLDNALVHRTVMITDDLLIDLDKNDYCMGVEFLNIDKVPDREKLLTIVSPYLDVDDAEKFLDIAKPLWDRL